MKHWLFLILAGCVLVAGNSSSASAQCEEATALYQQAIGQGVEVREKTRLLEKSLDSCRSYAAYYELGKAYAVNGELEKATEALNTALGYARDSMDDKIKVSQVLARVYRKYGKPDDAVAWYKAALRLSYQQAGQDKKGSGESTKELEQELMAIERQSREVVVPSARISATLVKGLGLAKAIAVEAVASSVDLRVNFAYDSHALTEQGRQQAEELAKALTVPELQGNRFRLVGHTDMRGTKEYNEQLSLSRAEAVRTYVLQHSNIDPKRIAVEGKGKREPLYSGDTDEAHALNRRVEVSIQLSIMK